MAKRDEDWRAKSSAELDKIFDVPFTFSRWCRTGLANYLPNNRCECWRCRQKRNEPVTPESEKLAEENAKIADQKNEEYMRGFLKDCREGRIT